MKPDLLDAVIIGGGPAGLAAGMHLSRAGYSALLVERGRFGGQARRLERVENYPGFPRGIPGGKLMSLWLEQARRWRLTAKLDEALALSRARNGIFSTRLKKSGTKRSRCVIWCAGSEFRALGVPEEEKFYGKGIWNTADEEPRRLKTAVVAGGGEAAVQQAVLLSRRANRVYLITRSARLKAHRLLLKRLSLRRNVEWLPETLITGLAGGRRLHTIELTAARGGKPVKRIETTSLFVLTGKEPRKIPAGWRREPAGFFRAGDASGEIFRQVAVAGGDGIRAAMRCIRYLEGM